MAKKVKSASKKATPKPLAKKSVKKTAKKVVKAAPKKAKKAIDKKVKAAKRPVKKVSGKATVAERLDHLLEAGVNPLMKLAGFKKNARVYRRNLPDLIQVVQIHTYATETGGVSAPKGFFKIIVGCAIRALSKKAAPYEYDCHLRFSLHNAIPQVHPYPTWDIPLTSGKQRITIENDILSSFQLLIKALDALKTKSDISILAREMGTKAHGLPYNWL